MTLPAIALAAISDLILATVPLLSPASRASLLMPVQRRAACERAQFHSVAWIVLDRSATKHLAIGHSASEARMDSFADHRTLEFCEGSGYLEY